MEKDFVLSLGGSIIVPNGVDVPFLKGFRDLILGCIKKGQRFGIVTGGGKVCRDYYAGAEAVTADISFDDMSILGVAVTRANAQLVRVIFGKESPNDIIYDPTKPLKFEKSLLFGAGFKPGTSTDFDAVLIAKNLGVKTVLNLSNITYVYDKDPKAFPDAKPIEKMSWKDFAKKFGSKWVPGMHTPFDPRAAELAAKEKMTVIVADGRDLKNLAAIFEGKKFKGTTIQG